MSICENSIKTVKRSCRSYNEHYLECDGFKIDSNGKELGQAYKGYMKKPDEAYRVYNLTFQPKSKKKKAKKTIATMIR